jgi:hypothetical protein
MLACLAVLCLATPANAAPCTEPGSLVSTHIAARGRHELAVFVFRKPAQVTHEVQAVTPPFMDDPSETPVSVGGDKFTEIRFRNVSWMCSIAENFQTPRQAIIDVKRSSQFEGIVAYIIGRNVTSRFISVYSYDTKSSRVVVVKFRR